LDQALSPAAALFNPGIPFFEPDKIHYPKGKHPWYGFLLKDRGLFAIAGIYDVWTDPQTGTEVFSYAMVTVEPDAVVGEVHARMPAIFASREDEQDWINPDITEADRLLSLLNPFPSDRIEGWHVPDLAKNPRYEGADALKRVEEETEPKQERLI
jgi:putative SOS response-associated peptidase YedK